MSFNTPDRIKAAVRQKLKLEIEKAEAARAAMPINDYMGRADAGRHIAMLAANYRSLGGDPKKVGL
jgi:hypothetical protein